MLNINNIEKIYVRRRIISFEADCGRLVSCGVKRGCSQGGVLSPLLWNLLVDSLLTTVNDIGVYCQAYADDVSGLIVGSCLKDVSNKFQTVLNVIDH